MTSQPAWWQTAVVYQIYPRSFFDSNGDGIGDIRGIRERIDHIIDLGFDAVWLSPVFPSPMVDLGYDVSDFCDVDPIYGDLAELDGLLADLHAHGIRLLLDWVPNHTSDQHSWFKESRSSRVNPKRDWYFWRDPAAGSDLPNRWLSSFQVDAKPVTVEDFLRDDGKKRNHPPAWTFDPLTGQYYLHLFLPQQPDLNWRNPDVVRAMHETIRFWLNRGIDGFRIDIVHGLGKDEQLADTTEDLAGLPKSATNDHPFTHELLRGLRTIFDEYEDRAMVGEVFLLDPARVAPYYGDGDELQMAFNFLPLFTAWDADLWETRITEVLDCIDTRGHWPVWVLGNHDVPRLVTRYGSEARARAAAVLLLTLRGTAFVYAGDEIGLQDAYVPEDERVDLGGRDAPRAPLPWDSSDSHGWPTDRPWLPWPPDPTSRNVETQRRDPASMLNLYRRLLEARRSSGALRAGTMTLHGARDGVLRYERSFEDDRRAVLINFTDSTKRTVAEPWTIEVSTCFTREGEVFDGLLGPNEAVILKPQTENELSRRRE